MTEKPFDFLQDHSGHVPGNGLRYRPHGTVGGPGRRRPSHRRLRGYGLHVAQAARRGDRAGGVQVQGCLNTVASANAVAALVEGRPLAEAWEITPERVIELLETLPRGHHHCAELAVGALYRALADLRSKQREPWRKLYAKGG